MVFNFDAVGLILGLGYVMGLRSSMILCAGGLLANFVLVPLIWFIGSHIRFGDLSGGDFNIQDDRGTDLPQLRALRWSGRNCDRGNFRDHKIA